MAFKKSDKEPSEQDQLIKKIDDMMDIKGPGPKEPRADDPTIDVKQFQESLNQSLKGTTFAGDSSNPSAPVTAPTLPKDQLAKDNKSDSKVEEKVPEEIAEEIPDVKPDDKVTQTEKAEPEAELSVPPETELPEANIDDAQTQKAVDDIVAKEGDTLLAVEDAKKEAQAKAVVSKVSFGEKMRLFFRKKWLWVIPLILIVLFAVPVTRYKILGLVIKKNVTIVVEDSKTSTSVSSAEVVLGGTSSKTDANGKAVINVGLGQRDLSISKPYYQTLDTTFFVGFSEYKGGPLKLTATGRLVPIKVTNKITGKPLANVTITAQKTTAKTDKAGIATIALPTKQAKVQGKISGSGLNPQTIEITVTNKQDKQNNFAMVTSGQIYFLSNQSGNLDVVKSNLDGSERKTVLAGTGKEDQRTTSLLASRDWRYLVLKARRDQANPSLYVIDTKTDKVTQFDTGDGDFNLVGWYDHNFIYQQTKPSVNYWQPGRQVVKGYDADKSQLSQLDQSQGEGSNTSYAYQEFFNFYILNGLISYNTAWSGYNSNGAAFDLSAKTDSIRGIQPNGQGKKDYQTFQSASTNFIQASLYEPNGVYYAVYTGNNKAAFYSFENQTVKPAAIDQATFDKQYPTYLLSPNGNQTFWSEQRDGKNTLFIGDKNAGNKKQIASASELSPYGWFSDDYVLLAKNSSELYIASPASILAGSPSLKITDYYKPPLSYSGYGYGYGGL